MGSQTWEAAGGLNAFGTTSSPFQFALDVGCWMGCGRREGTTGVGGARPAPCTWRWAPEGGCCATPLRGLGSRSCFFRFRGVAWLWSAAWRSVAKAPTAISRSRDDTNKEATHCNQNANKAIELDKHQCVDGR